MGCGSGAKISRYELFACKPNLETVLAYEILFGVPARELFGGIFETVHKATHGRVQALIKRLASADSSQATAAKLAALRAIAESKAATANFGGHA
jgi:hypothetical protein